MLTRKNPARASNKPSATQPQPANHQDHPTQPLASGDAGPPSPTARRAPKAPMLSIPNGSGPPTKRADPDIWDENGQPIHDAESPEISRPGESEEDWLFKNRLVPRKDPVPPPLPSSFYYTDESPSRNQEDMMRDGIRPARTAARSALYELGSYYSTHTPPDDRLYPMDEDPAHPVDVASHLVPLDYELTPPTDTMYLVSQFNPLELAEGDFNPSGSPHIVQSAEHAYILMEMEAKGRLQATHLQTQNHTPPRPGGGPAPAGSVYMNGEGVAYAAYPDPRVAPHMLRQHHQLQHGSSPTSWQQQQQRTGGGATSGSWSAQQSPTAVPRGWQQQQLQQQQPQQSQPQTSPRNQGQDHHHPSASQQQHSPPPGVYRTQAGGWAAHPVQVQEQSQPQSHAGDRVTPPSSSPALWRPGQATGPGQGQGQGPSPQSAPTTTTTHVRQRDGSLSSWPPQGADPTRPPTSSIGHLPPPGSRYAGPNPGPSPVTTTNPAAGSWGPGHPMAAGPPPNSSGAGWPGQSAQRGQQQGPGGMQPGPSAGGTLLQHQPQPHPEIDGPADGMRWSAPNNATEPSLPRGWQAPTPEGNNNNNANANANANANNAGGDVTGRPTMQQVRMYGSVADRIGSNQALSSASARQGNGNARAPWATPQQMNNPPGGVPLDGRIQTPGGTGAMGGHAAAAAASAARPPMAGNPAPMAGGTYAPANNTQPQPGYASAYATRPGSVHGGGGGGQPTRPGEYGPAPGNEMPYSSQPDSMAAYRANSGPGGGGMPPQPPSSSVATGGAPQGYTMAGGPIPSGNPYPSVPPAPGATPYGMTRSVMISQQQQQQLQQQQQQQHHQQPPPGAHGNVYPNLYSVPQQQPPQQPQGQAPGSVYAPYTSGGPQQSLTYTMGPGGPIGRVMTRPPPGSGGMQMNPYATMGAPHSQATQEMYARMQGLPGAGGVDGYRPQQQQPH